jgi:hypothetical protein
MKRNWPANTTVSRLTTLRLSPLGVDGPAEEREDLV